MKRIYKINYKGIYEDVYLANVKEKTYYNGEEWIEIDFNYVEVQPPNAKVVKWEIDKWIVVEDYPVVPQEPQPPTESEELANYVLDVDFRVVMLEMGL